VKAVFFHDILLCGADFVLLPGRFRGRYHLLYSFDFFDARGGYFPIMFFEASQNAAFARLNILAEFLYVRQTGLLRFFNQFFNGCELFPAGGGKVVFVPFQAFEETAFPRPDPLTVSCKLLSAGTRLLGGIRTVP
jgi:hypothetical protein